MQYRDENLESMATSNPPRTIDAVFTKLPRPLAKDRKKHFSELATYIAFFSVTYLATSLKLAKFSVTERTAEARPTFPTCVMEQPSQENLHTFTSQLQP